MNIRPPMTAMLALAITAVAQTPVDAVVSHEEHRHVLIPGGLTVRLVVADRASLADESWLTIELENVTDRAIDIERVQYHTTARHFCRETGKPMSHGSLAGGNTADLFPNAYRRSRVALRRVAAHSVHRVSEQPSDYSTALLGVPPEAGWRVEARMMMDITFVDGLRASTPDQGIAFEFDWLPPEPGQVAEMQRRTIALLSGPGDRPHKAYILGALLEAPDVADGVPLEQLLAALTTRSKGSWDRDTIARHVAAHFDDHPTVRDFYVEQLEAWSWGAVSDLRFGIWHPEFVLPLVGVVELRTTPMSIHALDRLHMHRDLWQGNPEIAGRLIHAVEQLCPRSLQHPAEFEGEDLQRWASDVINLSKTGDRRLLTTLRPALDDKRHYMKPEHLANPRYDLPFRVCDCALVAMLDLLDGNARQAASDAGIRATTRDLDAISAIRDRMIKDLKARLDDLDLEHSPRQ